MVKALMHVSLYMSLLCLVVGGFARLTLQQRFLTSRAWLETGAVFVTLAIVFGLMQIIKILEETKIAK